MWKSKNEMHWPHSSKRTEIPPKGCTIWKARGKNTTTKIQVQMVRSRKRGHQLDGTTVEKAVDTWKLKVLLSEANS